MRRIVYLVLLLVFIAVSTSTVFGVGVKFVKEIPLVPNDKGELQKVVDFCTTDDGIFLIPDYLAGNIKLYEQNGEALVFQKNVGSKGYDPGQLVKPAFCSFNKTESKFVLLDMGTRRIYFYDRFGRDEFVREKQDNGNEVYAKCPKGAYNIQLVGDKLFVAGHIVSDDGFYEFYSMDLNELRDSNSMEENPRLFLKSNEIFPIDKGKNFVQQIEDGRLPVIGVRNYFDIAGNVAYFVWMGDLRVLRVDIASGAKVGDPFGKKTGDYVSLKQPSTELVDTFYQMRENNEARDKYFKEKRKFSTIRNLYTTSEYVILIYEGGKSEDFRAQFYLLDGKFVTEVPFRGQPGSIMHFERDKKVLYSLSKSEKGDYSVLVHKILE